MKLDIIPFTSIYRVIMLEDVSWWKGAGGRMLEEGSWRETAEGRTLKGGSWR